MLNQVKYLLRQATPAIATRFRIQVEVAADEIANRPAIGTPAVTFTAANSEVRSWPVPKFPAIRLYYTQQTDSIRVLRVLHGKRNVARIIGGAKRPRKF